MNTQRVEVETAGGNRAIVRLPADEAARLADGTEFDLAAHTGGHTAIMARVVAMDPAGDLTRLDREWDAWRH